MMLVCNFCAKGACPNLQVATSVQKVPAQACKLQVLCKRRLPKLASCNLCKRRLLKLASCNLCKRPLLKLANCKFCTKDACPSLQVASFVQTTPAQAYKLQVLYKRRLPKLASCKFCTKDACQSF